MVLMKGLRINLSQTCLIGSPLFKGEMSEGQRGSFSPFQTKMSEGQRGSKFLVNLSALSALVVKKRIT